MSRAIKPTKREIAALLLEKERTRLNAKRTELEQARETNRKQRNDVNGLLTTALTNLARPAKLTKLAKQLHALGIDVPAIDNPTINGDGTLHYTLKANITLTEDTKPTKTVNALKTRLDDLKALDHRLQGWLGNLDRARHDGNLLDVLIAKLPAEATPHLEALQNLMGSIIDDELNKS